LATIERSLLTRPAILSTSLPLLFLPLERWKVQRARQRLLGRGPM
jgi:hypothetical protein